MSSRVEPEQIQSTEIKIDSSIFAGIEPEPLENEVIIQTRELVAKADRERRQRGKFGGLTLGSERFYQLNQCWGGIDEGVHIIGGDSNLGKSSLLRMIAWDIIRFNPDVHLRFYTLDDAENYFFDCLIAQAARVPINAVHKPEAWIEQNPGYYSREDYQVMVDKGHQTYKQFVNGPYLERFSFIGADRLNGADWGAIQKDLQRAAAAVAPKKFVACFDNFHDIEIHGVTETNDKTEAVAKEVDRLATLLHCPFIGTVELKKNQQRRPILDDVYGSRKWKYKARSCILVYSEVGVGKPNPRIFFDRQDRPNEPCSVLELHMAKSKVNDFKGRLFYEQFTESGTMREVPLHQAQLYASQIS